MKRPKISKAGITDALGVVAGVVAANFAAQKLPIENQTLKNAVPIGVGLVLSMGKNKMLKNVGLGMVGAGGAKLVGGFITGGGLGRYMYSNPGAVTGSFAGDNPAGPL